MDADHFLDLLGKSGLVEEDRVDDALAQIGQNASNAELSDAEYVGQKFIEFGLLTPWHVRQLLKRRYKGFFIRQYKILGILGAGGMSTVYLAEHRLMQRRVAIKVLPKERLKKAAYLDHFVREAQVIATLDHPHIIRAYDIDREADIHYIVMEFFEGINLQKKVETEGPLTVPDIVYYVMQAAEALAYAHQVGIIHRDVKPGNLLVNSKKLVKLLDLGLAMIDQRYYSGTLSSNFQESSVLGTADYLAPEQAINSRNIDSRADIYALGGVLYFCLTGHSPFPSGSVPERLLAHQQKEPTSVLKDRPNTDPDLVEICKNMMAKHPDDRYQTAGEVVRALRHWLRSHGHSELFAVSSEETVESAPPAPRKHAVENTVESDSVQRRTVENPKNAVTPNRETNAKKTASPEKPEESEKSERVDRKEISLPPLPSLPNLPLPPLPGISQSGAGTVGPLPPKLPLPPLPSVLLPGKTPVLPLPPQSGKSEHRDEPRGEKDVTPEKGKTPGTHDGSTPEHEEYLAPRTPSLNFGKFEDDTATTAGAGPLIFGDRDGNVDLTEADYEATVARKTDPDLNPPEAFPPIDDSILSPDSSVDLGGKTDIDLQSHAEPAKTVPPVEQTLSQTEKTRQAEKTVATKANAAPSPKQPPQKKTQAAVKKPESAKVVQKSVSPVPDETKERKSQILVNEQKPLSRSENRPSAPETAASPGAVPTIHHQEQIVIEPPKRARDDSDKPDVFDLAVDVSTNPIPLQSEVKPPGAKPQRKGQTAAGNSSASTKPVTKTLQNAATPKTPQKPSPATPQNKPVAGRDPKKPVDDEIYDRMLTNFVTSTMPVKADEDDPAVRLAVQEMEREQALKPHRHRETIPLEKRGVTTMGIEMRTASSRIDEYIEEEKTQTETKPTQFEAAANWLAIVPVWFWAIFGFIAALAVVFGLMVALNLGTPS